jgi:hypothetical protein
VYSRFSFAALRPLLDRLPRPMSGEQVPTELRLREYLEHPGGVSESVASLADKFGVSRRQCQRVLEHMVQQGTLRRQDYNDIEPIYSRFPTRSMT